MKTSRWIPSALIGLGVWVSTLQAADTPRRPHTDGKIYTSRLHFSIPFNFPGTEASGVNPLVVLYCSADRGATWKPIYKVPADKGRFDFRADADGEYWFATRVLRDRTAVEPLDSIQPELMVVVDTAPPEISLEAALPRPAMMGVSWKVRDSNPAPDTFQLYRRSDQGWLQITTPPGMNQAYWPASVASGPVSVRAVAKDLAGNEASAVLELPAASPAGADRSKGAAGWVAEGLAARSSKAETAPSPGPAPTRAEPAPPAGAEPVTQGPEDTAAMLPPDTQVVNTRRCAVRYHVEDVGPSGLARIELWVTTDRGVTWKSAAQDTDCQSPVDFVAEEDGLYGITLVARSGAGLGDQAPASGTRPQMYVLVDTTPPAVKLTAVEPGSGDQASFLYIRWTALDANFGPGPISLYYSTDGAAWRPISEGIANTGSLAWPVPAEAGFRFYIRLKAVDLADNHAEAVTAEPITVDRHRPKGRILSVAKVAPAAPAASGPSPAVAPTAREERPVTESRTVIVPKPVAPGEEAESTADTPPKPIRAAPGRESRAGGPAAATAPSLPALPAGTADAHAQQEARDLKRQADYYLLRGDFTRAQTYLEKALKAWPAYAAAHNDLAGVYYKLGQLEAAIEHYETARKLDARDPKPLVGLGCVWWAKKDYVQARQFFEQVVKLDPEDVEARVELGKVCLNLFKQTGEASHRLAAVEHFQTAVKTGDRNNESVQEAQQLLTEIR